VALPAEPRFKAYLASVPALTSYLSRKSNSLPLALDRKVLGRYGEVVGRHLKNAKKYVLSRQNRY
jgi:hypothetical protein